MRGTLVFFAVIGIKELSMAQSETVERILRTATLLFAERGFAETSLRTITSMADVNLAAVNLSLIHI